MDKNTTSHKFDIEWVNPNDLTPYENNPRLNDEAVEKVAKSIEQFGWQQPIVYDSLKAAISLGLDKVPVKYVDELTEEQIKKYRLIDNKVGELAGWDFEKLDLELDELIDLGVDDLTDFGFTLVSEEDINRFFSEREKKEDESGDSEADTPSAEVEVTRHVQCPCCGEWFDI